MKKIVHWIMLSCKKATALIEKNSLFSLSLKESIQLRLHKTVCDACTTYEKQNKKIDELLCNHIHFSNIDESTLMVNEPLQERIIKSL